MSTAAGQLCVTDLRCLQLPAQGSWKAPTALSVRLQAEPAWLAPRGDAWAQAMSASLGRARPADQSLASARVPRYIISHTINERSPSWP